MRTVRVRSLALLVFLLCTSAAAGQTLPATGGFLEQARSVTSRASFDSQETFALPARGAFTFPAPYGTTGIRLTNASDCGGADCLTPVGYSYWNNINNHAGSDTMLVVLTLYRERGGAGPSLFSVNKTTGATRNLGPLFPPSSPLSWATGEGWYFSRTRPHTLYLNSGPRLLRYDVQTRTFETVFDITGQFGEGRYIWQVHSSNDDRVHSATLRDNHTWANVGCIAYREDLAQWYFAPAGADFDECQVDKSGRWLVIKENVDGKFGEDNRIIDLHTGREHVLLDQNGAGGHSDLGYGYMVAADNFSPHPGTVRVWRFDKDLQGGQPVASVSGQGTTVYGMTSWGATLGHIAHGNARPDVPLERQIACNSSAHRSMVPRVNDIICYRLDGSLETLVVAPNLASLDAKGGGASDYSKMPKGNLDPTGEYFIWTANAGTDRLDAYIVRVPTALLDPVPPLQPVQWTDRVNVAVYGTTLQKMAGCSGCADAGAASAQKIAEGDGLLQFTASELSTSRLIGFSVGNTGTLANEILYGLRLRAGLVEVREAGIYRKDVTFTTGDVFEIRIEGAAVRYVKNGAVFYTSTIPPQYPLVVDTSLSSVGATFASVLIRQGS